VKAANRKKDGRHVFTAIPNDDLTSRPACPPAACPGPPSFPECSFPRPDTERKRKQAKKGRKEGEKRRKKTYGSSGTVLALSDGRPSLSRLRLLLVLQRVLLRVVLRSVGRVGSGVSGGRRGGVLLLSGRRVCGRLGGAGRVQTGGEDEGGAETVEKEGDEEKERRKDRESTHDVGRERVTVVRRYMVCKRVLEGGK
jgi:hypothetical protein